MSAAARLRQGDVELLLDDLRRLVGEGRRLKEGNVPGPVVEANGDEIGCLR
jgi:hypothetical protein